MGFLKSLLVLLSISYLGIWANCTKNLDCRGTIHNFEAFFKAYPTKDSIHINDTIWLEMQTATQLRDVSTNAMIDFSDAANFGTVVGFGELIGGDALNPGAVAAANDFETILITGSTVPSIKPEQVREFLFKENNSSYQFKVGIVPKKKGRYLIGIGNAAGVYQKKNSCRKSNVELTFKGTNQHLYLLEESRPGYIVSGYERTHAYAFKVY